MRSSRTVGRFVRERQVGGVGVGVDGAWGVGVEAREDRRPIVRGGTGPGEGFERLAQGLVAEECLDQHGAEVFAAGAAEGVARRPINPASPFETFSTLPPRLVRGKGTGVSRDKPVTLSLASGR